MRIEVAASLSPPDRWNRVRTYACDFLKEVGFTNFSKPDVHIKEIFSQLGLSATNHDIDVFKAVGRVARNVGVTAYEVDQLFWLVGSGDL